MVRIEFEFWVLSRFNLDFRVQEKEPRRIKILGMFGNQKSLERFFFFQVQ
jgi:hypothetical protein